MNALNTLKKLNGLLLCLFFSLSATNAQPTSYFHTVGATLYDPCGNAVTLRGVNYAVYNWGYSPNEIFFREIAKTGANAVRISWYVNDANTAAVYSAANLARALDSCLANKMIPILELHDQTCANNPTGLTALTSFFTNAAVKSILQARQNKLIINYANEALHVMWTGDAAAAAITYKNTYIGIITTLRTAGYRCPIMLDASDCGQHSDLFATVATPIIAADPDHNVIFSAHAYWYGYANTQAAVQTKLQAMVAANIPFVLGEIANQQDDTQNCQYNLDYQTILQEAQNRNIGWLCWSWNRDVCPNRQMTTVSNFNTLTPYGNVIVNNANYGLKAKAVRTPFMQNGFSCVVATERTEKTSNEPLLLTHSDSWELLANESELTSVRFYDLTGKEMGVFYNTNNQIIIPKPTIKGIYFLIGKKDGQLVCSKKVVVF